MAKIKMLCPFSKELCRECPQYRGRHYYLCYYTKYRGYLGGRENKAGKRSLSGMVDQKFEIPQLPSSSPKWLALNEFSERIKK